MDKVLPPVVAALENAVETFDLESAAFEAMRRRLLREHPGRFAVVSGDALLGVRDTQAEAFSLGLERIGLARPFLVRQISERSNVARLPAWLPGTLPT